MYCCVNLHIKWNEKWKNKVMWNTQERKTWYILRFYSLVPLLGSDLVEMYKFISGLFYISFFIFLLNWFFVPVFLSFWTECFSVNMVHYVDFFYHHSWIFLRLGYGALINLCIYFEVCWLYFYPSWLLICCTINWASHKVLIFL